MLDWDTVIVFGSVLLIVALGLGFAAYQRYLKHREWMAMIEKGIVPPDWEGEGAVNRSEASQRTSPITVTLVGIALTLGLLTLGFGPWLIGGLVPTAVGCAMLINQMMQESKAKKRDE